MNGQQNNLYSAQIFDSPAVNITRLILIPTKEYNDVYRRPYEMNINAGVLSTLENVIGKQLERNNSVTAMALAATTPDIMKMSDVPTSMVNIANGWNTSRLRFLMEVESDNDGATMISYIQGYTDYHDPSMFGRIDPRMPMHINSITNVIRTVNNIGNVNTRVNSSFNVLHDPYSSSYTIENTTMKHRLLRPKDVADGIDSIALSDSGVPITDNRSIYGASAQESKRNNNIGVQHVADVINSFALGKEMTDIGYDVTDMYNVASSGLTENNISTVPFIEALAATTGIIGTVDFDLELLSKINPNLESVLTLVDNNTQMISNSPTGILDTMNTERLDTVSMETTIANTISESVTSLLVDEMLSTISFSITNMTPNSEYAIAVSDVKSFIHGIDVASFADRFLNKFKALIMPGVTKNGLLGVDIFISSDVLGETTVAVGLNGNPPIVYRLPTFCNSLYTSMVGDENSYNVLVEDFSHILQIANIGN